jgi:hypothetical protein
MVARYPSWSRMNRMKFLFLEQIRVGFALKQNLNSAIADEMELLFHVSA